MLIVVYLGNMENLGGRPSLFNTPEELQEKINEYLSGYNGRPTPTITGLALFLGFESRQSFYDYEERDGFSYTIKRARMHIENFYEEKLLSVNTTGAIFALKNMGWDDKKQVENSGSMLINWEEKKTYASDDKADTSN